MKYTMPQDCALCVEVIQRKIGKFVSKQLLNATQCNAIRMMEKGSNLKSAVKASIEWARTRTGFMEI